MNRDDLFNELTSMSVERQARILCRLFGLMETYEETDRHLFPYDFFAIIENNTKLNKGGDDY